jgi:hypothetical protein
MTNLDLKHVGMTNLDLKHVGMTNLDLKHVGITNWGDPSFASLSQDDATTREGDPSRGLSPAGRIQDGSSIGEVMQQLQDI